MTDYISVADTAKIIREELKKHFPGVVFSVRSRTYSMGASIDVAWTDGPCKSAVSAITSRFEGSSFDGMQDMKVYRKSVWQGREVRWGSDRVSLARNYSLDFYTQVCHQVCDEKQIPRPSEIKREEYTHKGKTTYSRPFFDESFYRANGYHRLGQVVSDELEKISIVPGTAPVPVQDSSNGISVTVTENPAKGGIEIRFSGKPPADVIEALGKNGAGFKYSRAQNIWYAKRTDAKMAFAKSLVERFNQPVQPQAQQPEQATPLEGYETLNDAQKAAIDRNDRAEPPQIKKESSLVLLDCINKMIELCDRLITQKAANEELTEPELEGLSEIEESEEEESFSISEVSGEQGSEFVLSEENKAMVLAIAKLDPPGRRHWNHLYRIAFDEIASYHDGTYPPDDRTVYDAAILLITKVLTHEQRTKVKEIAQRDQNRSLTKKELVETLELPFATAQSLVYGDYEKVIGDIKRKRASRSKVLEVLDFIHENHPNTYHQKTYEHIKERITSLTKNDVQIDQAQVSALKNKLIKPNAYVCGTEYLGCVNSGHRSCIIHIAVNDVSYYCVGNEGGITDTYFEKPVLKIKALIKDGIVEDYETSTWGTIKVFTDFEDAESEYHSMNQRVVNSNMQDLDVITEAKKRHKEGTATIADYLELSDRGII